MPIPDPDKIWPKLDKLGVKEVRKKLAMGVYAKYKVPVIEEWLRRREEEMTAKKTTDMARAMMSDDKNNPLIFISYDTRDIEIVTMIDGILRRHFNDKVKTFIAKRDIKAGYDAFRTMLHDNLAKSSIVLAICTRRSLTSPWLWFESGAGFGSCNLIPIWAGITPHGFKAPMTIFQGKSIEEKTEMQELIARISEVTKVECDKIAITEEEFTRLAEIIEKLNVNSDRSDTVESLTGNKEITNDMDVIIRIFKGITSLKELDYFIDQALYPYLINSVLEQHEAFERYLQSSYFHVFDDKLRELINNFYIAWSAVCQHWEAFTPTKVPGKLRPNTSMDVATEEGVKKAIKMVPAAAKNMHQALQELLRYVRNTFKDIDL